MLVKPANQEEQLEPTALGIFDKSNDNDDQDHMEEKENHQP